MTSTRYAPDTTPEQMLEQAARLNVEHKLEISTKLFSSIPTNVNVPVGSWLMPCLNLYGLRGMARGLFRTFDKLSELIDTPLGYPTRRDIDLIASPARLRQVPGYDYRPGISWVIFDPAAYQGLAPSQAASQIKGKGKGLRLAGIEVLMAAVLLPDWIMTWDGDTIPYPWLSGLEIKTSPVTGWTSRPRLYRDDDRLRLNIDVALADGHKSYCSPTIRFIPNGGVPANEC